MGDKPRFAVLGSGQYSKRGHTEEGRRGGLLEEMRWQRQGQRFKMLSCWHCSWRKGQPLEAGMARK
jgi:hypothetical protein